MERAYIEQELVHLSHKELVSLVQRQKDRWPLTYSKIQKANKEDLKATLLDPRYAFTTNAPPVPPIVPSVPPVPAAVPSASIQQLNPIPGGLRSPTLTLLRPRMFSWLLIDDNRSAGSSSTSQRIQVKLIDRDNCPEGEWRANTLDIVEALQTSIGRLAGSARIGVPDPLDPAYTEYFVELIANEPVRSLAVNPELLIIPKDGRLNLRVNDIAHIGAHSQIATIAPSTQPAAATSSASSASNGARSRVKELTTDEMAWLKKQLSTRPGYTEFGANHSKVLQNVDRVSYWRFASYAKRDLHKKKWPDAVGSSKKISVDAIYQALDMKSTAFTEAVQMTKIIDTYTAAGPQYSPEVVAEVAKADEPDPNGRALRNFLLQWDKDHGSVSNEDDG
ncbi:hypothetical protein DFH06DRAFT_1393430 [Mycena polygramma]|nr:hypothetical protein DFH06DRAFT_1393430 [Mycena polygramma]